MKQEIPIQGARVEQAPVVFESIKERMPDLSSGEINGPDAVEAKKNADRGVSAAQEMILSTSLPAPVVEDGSAVIIATTNDNPAIAGDDDLIEMEWVKKAKKIIYETQDNPHLREEEVNKLQIDYVEKRYGRKVSEAK
jgi:hypothetical protein